ATQVGASGFAQSRAPQPASRPAAASARRRRARVGLTAVRILRLLHLGEDQLALDADAQDALLQDLVGQQPRARLAVLHELPQLLQLLVEAGAHLRRALGRLRQVLVLLLQLLHDGAERRVVGLEARALDLELLDARARRLELLEDRAGAGGRFGRALGVGL